MTYCRAPWIGYVINPNGENCCCHYFDNLSIQQKRIMIYNNDIPEICKKCGFRFLYFDKKYDDIFNINLKNFDINTGNIKNYCPGHAIIIPFFTCNAKCIMCTTFNNKKQIDFNKINNIDFSMTKVIILQGGELTLNKNIFLNILNLFPKDTHFSIMSNGMIYNEEILKTCNELNSTLTFSIDGYKVNNDIIRKGTKYDVIVNNINKVIKNYKIKIEISLTINTINAFSFKDDIIKIKKDINYKNIHFCIAPVINPYYLSIDSFNKKNKIKFLSYIKDIPKEKIIKILAITDRWNID